MTNNLTVAIVGAGFSGVALAVHLLQTVSAPCEIKLVSRDRRFGRGLAYGTNSPSHCLNVPAGRMGIDPENESGFVDYLREHGQSYSSGDFVPRHLYGSYLEYAVTQAENQAAAGVRLSLIEGEITSIESSADLSTTRLQTKMGESIVADKVVLALGNFAPQTPNTESRLEWTGELLVGNSWAPEAALFSDSALPILLIGSSLTAFDMALTLLDGGFKGEVVMLSRRGLLPQSHRTNETPPQKVWIPEDFCVGTKRLLNILREVRALVRTAMVSGDDWRDVVGGLRRHTPRLWQQLDKIGQAQFLRHLAPFWDTHRHRAAPAIGNNIRDYIRCGRIRLLAGRLVDIKTKGEKLASVSYRPRGGRSVELMDFQRVVNCTGPSSNLSRVDDALIRSLVGTGKIKADSLSLGLKVSECYRPIQADGTDCSNLWYLGPLLKSRYWEATAVPELRTHAKELAKLISSEIQSPTGN